MLYSCPSLLCATISYPSFLCLIFYIRSWFALAFLFDIILGPGTALYVHEEELLKRNYGFEWLIWSPVVNCYPLNCVAVKILLHLSRWIYSSTAKLLKAVCGLQYLETRSYGRSEIWQAKCEWGLLLVLDWLRATLQTLRCFLVTWLKWHKWGELKLCTV